MGKLEKKILDKINNDIVLSKDDCPLRYAPEWASKQIASEVQDIAIAFAKWKDGLLFKQAHTITRYEDNVYVEEKSYATLFSDFIEQYNK